MARSELSALVGTRWTGKGELWLDPLGNTAEVGDCSLEVRQGAVSYTWAYEGKAQQGTYSLHDGGADWMDSWHQPRPMACEDISGAWGLLAVFGTYGAGDDSRWGWRTTLSQRPSGELVLQMSNVAPWGEEGRAVRMVLSRTG